MFNQILLRLFGLCLLIGGMGCRTYHTTNVGLFHASGAAGITVDPDDFVDALLDGNISLRAVQYHYPRNPTYFVKVGGTWKIKWGRPHQSFEVIPSPPDGMEVISVQWGLGADAQTPHHASFCDRWGRRGYTFTVRNCRRGDVNLTIRALYGIRFSDGESEVRREEIARYTIHFAVSRFDGWLSPG